MASDITTEPLVEKSSPRQPATDWEPIRIWPPLVLLAGMVFFRFLPQLAEDGPPWIWMTAAFGPALCGILILIWWITFSRVTWPEKLVGFFGAIFVAGIALACIDKTMLGPAVMVLTIPLGTAAFSLGTIVCSGMLSFQRTVIALLFALVGFGVSTLCLLYTSPSPRD